MRRFGLSVLGVLAVSSNGSFVRAQSPQIEGAMIDEQLPQALPSVTADEENPLFSVDDVERLNIPSRAELYRAIGWDPEQDQDAAAPEPLPEQLLTVAQKVAASMVAVRAYDAYGYELASGCGCFVNASGVVLTDVQIVGPEVAGRVEYITVSTGTGGYHRVTGFWKSRGDEGVARLQTDAVDTLPAEIAVGTPDYSQERAVSVLSFTEERGLTLAEAFAKADTSMAGEGWVNVWGDDSPGESGSPILDASGAVSGVVSLRVPQGKWFSFGKAPGNLREIMARMLAKPATPLEAQRRATPVVAENDERFIAAFKDLSEGNARRALPALLVLRQQYPRSSSVWALLGFAAARLGAREEALLCQRKAVALDPDNQNHWRQLAFSQLMTEPGRPNAAAREALQKAVEQKPADTLSLLLLAEQEVLAENFEAAELALEKVMAGGGGQPSALFLLAYVKGKRGDLDGADAAIQQCLKSDRRSVRAWFYLGLIESKRGRLQAAAEAFGEVTRLQPGHRTAWLALAKTEKKLGRDASAQAAFSKHQQIKPRP